MWSLSKETEVIGQKTSSEKLCINIKQEQKILKIETLKMKYNKNFFRDCISRSFLIMRVFVISDIFN